MSLFPQLLLDVHDELIVDLFAGGGGASVGIESGLGRSPDVAVNHDEDALECHKLNHPTTLHLRSDVFEVCPRSVTQGRPVGLLWMSPDCVDHSKAKGGKPIRTKKRRALAWVGLRWAGQVQPRTIFLENVEEFVKWGPLIGKPGAYRRCPKRAGKTFKRFVRCLRELGYAVEWRELRACDFGAPTIRKRLFLIARRDGRPIVWPDPTHAEPLVAKLKGLKKWRTTAECIDWTIPMCSIFATKEEARAWSKHYGVGVPQRPLKPNTMGRIARGVKRFVLDSKKPYIRRVPWATVAPFTAGCGGRAGQTQERSADSPGGTTTAKADTVVVAPVLIPRYGEREGQQPRCRSVEQPASVVVPTANGDTLVAANLASLAHGESGGKREFSLEEPMGTQHSGGNKFALVAGLLGQNNDGFAAGNSGDGRNLDSPASTITTKGANQSLIAAMLDQANNGFVNRVGRAADDPISTIVANGGGHQGLIAAHVQRDFSTSTGHEVERPLGTITTEGGGKAALVYTFLTSYYGTGTGQEVDSPLRTTTTNDRFGLVTLIVEGQPHYIDDILMRMLVPEELKLCQGFPNSYVIDRGADGRTFSKATQVRLIGNSVPPQFAEALVVANVPEMIVRGRHKEVVLAS